MEREIVVNDAVWEVFCSIPPGDLYSVYQIEELVGVPYMYKKPSDGPFLVIHYSRGGPITVGGGLMTVLDILTGEIICEGHDGGE